METVSFYQMLPFMYCVLKNNNCLEIEIIKFCNLITAQIAKVENLKSNQLFLKSFLLTTLEPSKFMYLVQNV